MATIDLSSQRLQPVVLERAIALSIEEHRLEGERLTDVRVNEWTYERLLDSDPIRRFCPAPEHLGERVFGVRLVVETP